MLDVGPFAVSCHNTLLSALRAHYFLVDFLAFLADFLADFLATAFFAADFFEVAFLAAAFLTGAFFAGAFLAAVFLVAAFLVAAFLVAGFFSSDFLAATLAVTFFLLELAFTFLGVGSSATVPGKSITGLARSFSDNICNEVGIEPWAAVTKRDMVWDADSMVASGSTTPDFTNKRKVRSSTGTAWEPAAINAVRPPQKGSCPPKSRDTPEIPFGPPA